MMTILASTTPPSGLVEGGPPIAVDAAAAPSSTIEMLKPPNGFAAGGVDPDPGGVLPLVLSVMWCSS
jgi:hypothetical protein